MRKINVCIGSACHLKGSYEVIKNLQKCVEERGLQSEITINAAFCLGHCTKAVSVQVDDGEVFSLCPETVEEFFNKLFVEED